ncbi:MAG: hypothetical protein IPG89_20050 [Bacteroidetes bacterium]|nr:hypothetical protein [Bacteroidota bacterium]
MPGSYTTQSIAALQAGTYIITVTDSLCSFNQSVTVPNQSQVVVFARSSPLTIMWQMQMVSLYFLVMESIHPFNIL